jgi:hypothetical protein
MDEIISFKVAPHNACFAFRVPRFVGFHKKGIHTMYVSRFVISVS